VRGKWIETLTDSLSEQELKMITSALTILTNAARKTEEKTDHDCD
jgi:hypothetical protein